jgi:hypothetical protein
MVLLLSPAKCDSLYVSAILNYLTKEFSVVTTSKHLLRSLHRKSIFECLKNYSLEVGAPSDS